VVSLDPVRMKRGATAGTIIVDSGLINLENPAPGQPGVKDMQVRLRKVLWRVKIE